MATLHETTPDAAAIDEEKKNTRRLRSDSNDSENHIAYADHFANAKEAGVKPAFLAKCELVNNAIKEIGMGRFQYELFFTAGECRARPTTSGLMPGFGWFADNIWLQGISILLPAIENEFGGQTRSVKLLSLALYAGLIVGASFWGTSADVVG